MVSNTSLLPVHELLAALEGWRGDSSVENREQLAHALSDVLAAYGGKGAHLTLKGPSLPPLEIGLGSLAEAGSVQRSGLEAHDLGVEPMASGEALVWIDAPDDATSAIGNVLELTIDSAWSKQEARARLRQLDALDSAVRGIAGVQSVERVLQLIVDRVRELVDAQYAALGIVGPFGLIEQFVTSGLTVAERARIGNLPQGHGLLGLIMREDRSFLVDDIDTDPRRYGFPENHPEMHSFLGVPVRSKGHSIGNVYLTNKRGGGPFGDSDLRLVEMFALHAGIAMDNARLHEEIGRLAIVDERQRISQDLHDSIIQSLYAISLSLEDLPEIIAEDQAEGAARADRAIDGIHGTIRDIRNFIMGLQPELLAEAGVGSGLQTLAAEFHANTLMDLELNVQPDLPELPHDLGAHILAITREGLSNIARHSQATRASIELARRDGVLRLIISDNGRGFDTEAARSPRQHGLGNLGARAEALGGGMTLTSEEGAGTRLEVQIPFSEGSGNDD
ncbi:MAG: GAF domain-containing sensor histidine kinase [Chloroflexota bacterium]